MSLHPEPPHEATPTPGGPSERLAELARLLDRETALIQELEETLVQQRAGVAGNQADEVNGSVDAIGRLLVSLADTRTVRNQMLAGLGGSGTITLEQIETSVGPLPPSLEAARTRLRQAARSVAQQVAINRAVLRRAVEAGDAFLQALFSSTAEAPAVYAPGERREESPSGVLLNRRA